MDPIKIILRLKYQLLYPNDLKCERKIEREFGKVLGAIVPAEQKLDQEIKFQIPTSTNECCEPWRMHMPAD